jgi:hypothetical protein
MTQMHDSTSVSSDLPLKLLIPLSFLSCVTSKLHCPKATSTFNEQQALSRGAAPTEAWGAFSCWGACNWLLADAGSCSLQDLLALEELHRQVQAAIRIFESKTGTLRTLAFQCCKH